MSEIFNEWKKSARREALTLEANDVGKNFVSYIRVDIGLKKYNSIKNTLENMLPGSKYFLAGFETDSDNVYVRYSAYFPHDEKDKVEDFRNQFESKIIKDQITYPNGLDNLYYEAFLLM